VLIDTGPLRRHRDFRLLFTGQIVSDLGSAFTSVALPYQIYHLTGSSLAVRLIGLVQLIPLILAALLGGALADTLNRRKLLIASELGLTVCSAILALSALGGKEWTPSIYVLAGLLSVFKGLHRPSLEALTPRLVDKEELLAASALSSLRGTIARIGGPAIAGMSISLFGLCVAALFLPKFWNYESNTSK
jgi:MFS family permease